MKQQPILCSLLLGGVVCSPTTVHSDTASAGLAPLIEQALANNPDLMVQKARLAEAEARLQEATAAFLPRFSARVSYEYTNDPSRAFAYIVAQRRFDFGMDINQPGWVDNFRPELMASWSLYRGGEDHYRRQAAALGVEAAALEQQALQNRLAAAVTAAWYTWRMAPEQMEVARQSLQSIAAEQNHTRQRVEQGMALKADVLSLDVRQSASREAEIRAENALTLARSSLQMLVGGEVTDTPAPPAPTLPNPPSAIATLLQQALDHRPELQAANRQKALRAAELRAEKAAFLPRVTAYTAYGLNSRGPDINFSQDNLTLGLNAEVDLFSGGATRARIAAAEQRLVAAEALIQRTRLSIEDEVRRAAATLDETLKRSETAERGQQAADEALRLVHLQYQAGSAAVTRYLDAETDRAEARLRAIMAHYEAYIADAQLQQAVGTLSIPANRTHSHD
jgi:outer membrane protein TolC